MSAIDSHDKNLIGYGKYTKRGCFYVYQMLEDDALDGRYEFKKGDILLGGGGGEHPSAQVNIQEAINSYFPATHDDRMRIKQSDECFSLNEWDVSIITNLHEWRKKTFKDKLGFNDHNNDFTEHICVSLILYLNKYFPELLEEYLDGKKLILKSSTKEWDYDYTKWRNKIFHPLREWVEDENWAIGWGREPLVKNYTGKAYYLSIAEHREKEINKVLK